MEKFLGLFSLIILIGSFILGIIFSARPYKRKRFLTFSKCLPAGIFFSALSHFSETKVSQVFKSYSGRKSMATLTFFFS